MTTPPRDPLGPRYRHMLRFDAETGTFVCPRCECRFRHVVDPRKPTAGGRRYYRQWQVPGGRWTPSVPSSMRVPTCDPQVVPKDRLGELPAFARRRRR